MKSKVFSNDYQRLMQNCVNVYGPKLGRQKKKGGISRLGVFKNMHVKGRKGVEEEVGY